MLAAVSKTPPSPSAPSAPSEQATPASAATSPPGKVSSTPEGGAAWDQALEANKEITAELVATNQQLTQALEQARLDKPTPSIAGAPAARAGPLQLSASAV